MAEAWAGDSNRPFTKIELLGTSEPRQWRSIVLVSREVRGKALHPPEGLKGNWVVPSGDQD